MSVEVSLLIGQAMYDCASPTPSTMNCEYGEFQGAEEQSQVKTNMQPNVPSNRQTDLRLPRREMSASEEAANSTPVNAAQEQVIGTEEQRGIRSQGTHENQKTPSQLKLQDEDMRVAVNISHGLNTGQSPGQSIPDCGLQGSQHFVPRPAVPLTQTCSQWEIPQYPHFPMMQYRPALASQAGHLSVPFSGQTAIVNSEVPAPNITREDNFRPPARQAGHLLHNGKL